MATVSSRSSVSACARQRPTVSRRLTVVPKAFSLQEWTSSIANGFVRIFSKPQSNVETFAENNFQGKISHHGARKPFADGFSVPMTPAQIALERTEAEAEDYLQGAVNRVANHQFKGDSSEPKSYPINDGFQGDIHGKGSSREGFHSNSKTR